MKNLIVVGMLFASMSVFAQNAPQKEVAQKENHAACCVKSDKMKKAPARAVNEKEKSVRSANGQLHGHHNGVQVKKGERKVRVAVPGERKSVKVEEKM